MASNGVVAPVASSEAQVVVDEQQQPEQQLTAQISKLEIAEEKSQQSEQQQEDQQPPHRSHDPQFNQKRSDPFQFGSRYLQEQDDVFEFNAWDHVETDDAYKEYAEQQYEMQRNAPVSDFDKRKFTTPPSLHPPMVHAKREGFIPIAPSSLLGFK